jgi:hypothetical protein
MSQIDKLTFISSLFWFIILFLLFYFIIYVFFLRITFTIISIRKYIYFLILNKNEIIIKIILLIQKLLNIKKELLINIKKNKDSNNKYNLDYLEYNENIINNEKNIKKNNDEIYLNLLNDNLKNIAINNINKINSFKFDYEENKLKYLNIKISKNDYYEYENYFIKIGCYHADYAKYKKFSIILENILFIINTSNIYVKFFLIKELKKTNWFNCLILDLKEGIDEYTEFKIIIKKYKELNLIK